MRPFWKCCSVLGLIAVGYLLGASQMFAPRPVEAQADSAAPSEESLKKLKEAFTAIKIAAESLEQEAKYVPATTMLNVFAVTAGGFVTSAAILRTHVGSEDVEHGGAPRGAHAWRDDRRQMIGGIGHAWSRVCAERP